MLNADAYLASAGLAELEEKVQRLEKVNRALMGRVERSMDFSGNGFSLFQTAILLEDRVKARTRDLERTVQDLSAAYERLQEARDEADDAKLNLTAAIEAVSEGFALFDDSECLVMCNSHFRALMPDIGDELVAGLSFPQMAALFASSKFMALDSDYTKATWRSKRVELFRKPAASFIQQFLGDRWIQISNKRTHTGATVIFQTDITDTVRHERIVRDRQLDEQSKILQATIDHLPQGICMFSQDMRLRAWNSRFIELLALQVRLVTAGAGFERILSSLRGTLFATDPASAKRVAAWLEEPSSEMLSNVELTRVDGLILSVSTNIMPDGGVVASFTDVTQERSATLALREAKENLEQRVEERTQELRNEVVERRAIGAELIEAKNAAEEANKDKTRFLAAASHDILQPLNAARLFLTLLGEADLDLRQIRLVDKANHAFASVEQLLESILDISRIDSGSVAANLTAVCLHDLFETLASEYQPIAERKGLNLKSVQSKLFVRSDAGLLRRVVQNLMANAIRYTETGRVLLGLRRCGPDVRIEVWDTGVGIPAGKTKEVFEEFQRLDKDSPTGTKAMGLGLAIVQRIANLLDHEINVRSWPGKGSCFSITVPVTSPIENPAIKQSVARRKTSDLRGMTAIVIENDLQILEGMIELLEARGIKAVPTVSVNEALEALESVGKAPDVIVADYHLDNGTGLDAIKALRQLCNKAVPAIVITADYTAEVEEQIVAEEVSLFFKPIRHVLLFERLEEIRRNPDSHSTLVQ
jgi:two-component system, sensor histidine kinase